MLSNDSYPKSKELDASLFHDSGFCIKGKFTIVPGATPYSDATIWLDVLGVSDPERVFRQGRWRLESHFQGFPPLVKADGLYMSEVAIHGIGGMLPYARIKFHYIEEIALIFATPKENTIRESEDIGKPPERLNFVLSRTKYFARDFSQTYSENGERRERIRNEHFFIYKKEAIDGIFRIKKRFALRQTEDEETLFYRFALCWESSHPSDDSSFPHILRAAQEVTLLTSFLLRHRVFLNGYELSSGATDYRLVTFNPTCQISSELEEREVDYMVEISDFDSAMEAAIESLTNMELKKRDAVLETIASIVAFTKRTKETEFLANFTSLEKLAKHFLDDDIPSELENSWQDVKTTIQKTISELNLNDASKAFLEKNLRNLKMGAKTERMIDCLIVQLGIVTHGLWPVTKQHASGTQPRASLYHIRNKLAHGEVLRNRYYALSIAADHLRILIERCLLSILSVDTSLADFSKPEQIRELFLFKRNKLPELMESLIDKDD